MINFTKMHGLGNDFVVMNNIDGDISLSIDEIRKLSDRRFGIGFDQLLRSFASCFPFHYSVGG